MLSFDCAIPIVTDGEWFTGVVQKAQYDSDGSRMYYVQYSDDDQQWHNISKELDEGTLKFIPADESATKALQQTDKLYRSVARVEVLFKKTSCTIVSLLLRAIIPRATVAACTCSWSEYPPLASARAIGIT